jgi:hypothetical protein
MNRHRKNRHLKIHRLKIHRLTIASMNSHSRPILLKGVQRELGANGRVSRIC